MRIAMGIEYDGSGYSGWQLQRHSPHTVQQVVESAVGRVANHPLRIHCAGRTDTAVHASGQVIHFDTEAERSERSWVYGTNSNLPDDVVCLWAHPVDAEFHARFSATHRAYRYVIFSRHVRPTFLAHRVTWSHQPLALQPMQQAAQYLVGEHDFSSYRAVACQAKSPVRNLQKLTLTQSNDYIFIDVMANGFLHHMVRNIAGVMMAIGRGDHAPEWAREVLEARDRRLGGITAPAQGLYLTEVGYPSHYRLPQLPPSALVW